MKCDLEDRLELLNCEICSEQIIKKEAVIDVKEFHTDGTIKIHHSCSNHIVDLYNKIEIDNLEEQQEKLIAI